MAKKSAHRKFHKIRSVPRPQYRGDGAPLLLGQAIAKAGKAKIGLKLGKKGGGGEKIA